MPETPETAAKATAELLERYESGDALTLEERTAVAKLHFVASIESGDRLTGLLALRLMLAARLAEGVPARDLAALTRRLMQVMEELEQLGADDDDEQLSPEDELAARRLAVLSAADVERASESG